MTTLNRHQKIAKAVPKTITDTDTMSSLRTKLRVADPKIQSYVIALEKENLKLQRQIGKHQAENVTLNNRIKALEEYFEKKKDQKGGEIILNVVKVPHRVHKKSPL
jgi:hypothetical protein